ncbi:MAG: M23 family metallopeptidase [Eubacteriales bacterium]|nr:M23 family metallopeptidase [Eubacteriales bacterium]
MNEDRPHIDLGEMESRTPRRRADMAHRRRTHSPEAAPRARRESEEAGMGSLPLQLFVCGAICLVIIGMKYIDLPVMDDALQGLKIAVSAQSDVDSALGKLKFVTNLFPEKATEVFNPQDAALSLPVSGTVMGMGSESPYAVEVVCDAQQPVKAAAGRVFYSGSSISYDTMVRLVHDDGYETIYTGFAPQVKAGDNVEAGQSLGVAEAGSSVLFMVYRDGAAVRASDYLREK